MDRYKLITFAPQYNDNAKISITKFTDSAAVVIPESYFRYGWRSRLDFPAKVMYLLNLYYSATSLSRPQWSMAAETIAQRHACRAGSSQPASLRCAAQTFSI
jgi:hypothetical protein